MLFFKIIELNFTQFSIGAMFSSICTSNLSLYDGIDDNSPLIGTYCNGQQIQVIVVAIFNQSYYLSSHHHLIFQSISHQINYSCDYSVMIYFELVVDLQLNGEQLIKVCTELLIENN